MHILMLTPEYPPHVVGGLGRHVAELSHALAELGSRVTVLHGLRRHEAADEVEERGALTVLRARDHAPGPPGLAQEVVQRNVAMLQAVLQRVAAGERFDVVHAHDWLTAHAARAVKHALQIPLIATIHATEMGRNGGLFNEVQRHISDTEWWLAFEAWRVICCSRAMREELVRVFQVPLDKLHVIPNGVAPEPRTASPGEILEARRRYAADSERLIFFVGRLVYEKGVDLLIRALPRVLAAHPQTVLVVAGKGPEREGLEALARDLGVWGRVRFAGHIGDGERNRLYQAADVAVVPSRYEPFGIVALEAMALGAPLVAAGAGGLAEVVEHGRTGLLFRPGDPWSLAEQLIAALDFPALRAALRRHAREAVRERFDWKRVAERTLDVYRSVLYAARAARQDARAGGARLVPVGRPGAQASSAQQRPGG